MNEKRILQYLLGNIFLDIYLQGTLQFGLQLKMPIEAQIWMIESLQVFVFILVPILLPSLQGSRKQCPAATLHRR